jgi:hypothetical protein
MGRKKKNAEAVEVAETPTPVETHEEVAAPPKTALVTWRHWGAWATYTDAHGSLRQVLLKKDVPYVVLGEEGEDVILHEPNLDAPIRVHRSTLTIA